LVRSSNRLDLDLELEAGNREEIEPFELVIPLQGLDTISGYWLVFDIAETNDSDPINPAFSHAHSRMDLF